MNSLEKIQRNSLYRSYCPTNGNYPTSTSLGSLNQSVISADGN